MRQTNIVPVNNRMCSACNAKQSNKLQQKSEWKDKHVKDGDLKTKNDSEVGESFRLFSSHCHSE